MSVQCVCCPSLLIHAIFSLYWSAIANIVAILHFYCYKYLWTTTGECLYKFSEQTSRPVCRTVLIYKSRAFTVSARSGRLIVYSAYVTVVCIVQETINFWSLYFSASKMRLHCCGFYKSALQAIIYEYLKQLVIKAVAIITINTASSMQNSRHSSLYDIKVGNFNVFIYDTYLFATVWIFFLACSYLDMPLCHCWMCL